ncbi:MazG nucleotide pyrophosphohydrolase domain-containing protein [Nitrospira sp. NS4]|uniref:MazG nucleotide pyrophosphohydrolase domain-containing protein n=1 Tax=Nitrospira sp. NS4 TaxID=3414498 RepID=UPI002CC1C961|nr:MazG nucleotide pyrophosphohydrolase domain-containing protein [Nitrospira sp.]
MTDEQAMVEEFHRKFEIVVQTAPAEVSEDTKRLRVRLIQEEFDELKESMAAGDLPAVAKEMADLLYVVYGTAVSYGIDMDPVFREVHRSNLSKVGGYKRADGKWVKPATYSPAQVAPLLAVQAQATSEALEAPGDLKEAAKRT